MKQAISNFRRVRTVVGAAVCVCFGATASPARALPLQEIIEHAQRAVVHVSVSNDRGKVLGTGSGFVVSDDGRVVTNHHVVEGGDRAEVTFKGGRTVEVEGVLAFDEEADLAVLKLRKGAYSKLGLAAAPATQGDSVVVIGSPLGFSGSVSTGIVAAIRTEGATFRDQRRASWALQVTAPISSGSSGSPIMNDQGEVVGLIVGGVDAPVGQPVNFGVPVALVKKLLVASTGETRPLRALRGGRSPARNILISVAVLGGAVFAFWFAGYLRRRKLRRERGRGRDVLGSILKP